MEGLKLSGRVFTIAFALLLIVGVVLGISMAVRFQQTLQALEKLRSTWPAAAGRLDERYQEIDRLIADESNLSDEAVQRWKILRAAFQQSNRYDTQARFVTELESLRTELGKMLGHALPQVDAASDVASFIEADRAYDALEGGWLGGLCKSVFRLDVPARIHRVFE